MQKKSYFMILLAFAIFLLSVPSQAVLVEQSQAVMPLIDVYLCDNNGEGLDQVQREEITASIDGTLLQVVDYGDAVSLSGGTCYYYLLDISRSITDYDFAAVKKAVLQAHSQLSPKDQLVLITFGDTVSTVLRGGESRSAVEAALSEIRPADMTTALYAAIQRALELAPGKAKDGLRNIIIVATDGADVSESGVTLEELQSRTQYNGLSLFALCTRTSTQAKRDSLGSLARATGGDLYLFDAGSADTQLNAILQRLDNSMLLRLQAESNLADGGIHDLSIVLGDLSSITTKVTTAFWTPDDVAPTLLQAQAPGSDGTILLTFSEPVAQIEALSNYTLRSSGGERVDIGSVSYAGVGMQSVELRPASVPFEGKYSLTVRNLTDRSMEHNTLPETQTELFLHTGVFPAPDPTPEPETPAKEPGSLWWLYVLIAAAVILILALLISFLARREKRDNEEKVREALVRSGGRPGLTGTAAATEAAAVGASVRIAVVEGESSRTVEVPLHGPVYIGRSDVCALQLPDSKASRRHCSLSLEHGKLTLEDLGSRNGTLCNDVPVTQPTVVHPGDVLEIGDSKLRILDIQSGSAVI